MQKMRIPKFKTGDRVLVWRDSAPTNSAPTKGSLRYVGKVYTIEKLDSDEEESFIYNGVSITDLIYSLNGSPYVFLERDLKLVDLKCRK
jgi:hypothetical protein